MSSMTTCSRARAASRPLRCGAGTVHFQAVTARNGRLGRAAHCGSQGSSGACADSCLQSFKTGDFSTRFAGEIKVHSASRQARRQAGQCSPASNLPMRTQWDAEQHSVICDQQGLTQLVCRCLGTHATHAALRRFAIHRQEARETCRQLHQVHHVSVNSHSTYAPAASGIVRHTPTRARARAYTLIHSFVCALYLQGVW